MAAASVSAAHPSTATSPRDVYNFLKPVPKMAEYFMPDPLDAALLATTEVSYVGGRDEKQRYHGHGTLVSTLGFTYTGEFYEGWLRGSGRIQWTRSSSGIASGTISSSGAFAGSGGDGARGHGEYTGSFEGNLPHGHGAFLYANGDWYKGFVKHGTRDGSGSFFSASTASLYEGEWKNDERCGRGIERYSEASSYDGEWLAGKRHGIGRMQYANGAVYIGEWQYDVPHGNGTMGWKLQRGELESEEPQWSANGTHDAATHSSSTQFEEFYRGEWKKGKEDGRGISIYVKYPSESVEKKEKSARMPDEANCQNADDDEGKSLSKAHSVSDYYRVVSSLAFRPPPPHSIVNRYDGDFANGKRHGFGRFAYSDGSAYEGEWENGAKHGLGKVSTSLGACTYHRFVKNKIVDAMKSTVTRRPPLAPAVISIPKDASKAAVPLDKESTPLMVPVMFVDDLFGVGTWNPLDSTILLHSVVLRHHSLLKHIFEVYCTPSDPEYRIPVAPDWFEDCIAGEMKVMQLLRCLRDAHILDVSVSISSVCKILCDVMTAVRSCSDEYHAPVECLHLPWRDRWQEYEKNLYLLRGFLDYRSFVECLIRLSSSPQLRGASTASVSECFGLMADKHLVPLKAVSESVHSLFPLTQKYREIFFVPNADRLNIFCQLFCRYASIDGLTRESLFVAKRARDGNSVAGTLLSVRQWLLMLRHANVLRGLRTPDTVVPCTMLHIDDEACAAASGSTERNIAGRFSTLEMTLPEFVEATLRVATTQQFFFDDVKGSSASDQTEEIHHFFEECLRTAFIRSC